MTEVMAVPMIAPHGGVNLKKLVDMFQRKFLEYQVAHATDAQGFLTSLGFTSHKDRVQAMSWWMGMTYPSPADVAKLRAAFGEEILDIFGA